MSRYDIDLGAEAFNRLVLEWALQLKDAGLTFQDISDLSRAASGSNFLDTTYLSNLNRSKLDRKPSVNRLVAVSATNEHILRLKAGDRPQPFEPKWLKATPIVVNGAPADVPVLAQVASGQVIPSEIAKWIAAAQQVESSIEDGLRALIKEMHLDLPQLIEAYAPTSLDYRRRMLSVLSGFESIAPEDLNSDLEALAQAINKLAGTSYTADSLKAECSRRARNLG